MIYLFTTYYDEKDFNRKKELDFCIDQNLKNPLIDKIYLLNESPELFSDAKIITKKICRRPSFNDFFLLINQEVTAEDISIIANTDIVFNDSLKLIYSIPNLENKCLALGRWDYLSDSKLRFNQNDYSQDVWIFKGNIKKINGEFLLGMMGCDNKIAYEISRAGYNLLNPSLSIIATHHHRSEKRNYNNKFQLPPPHKFVLPRSLECKLKYILKYNKYTDYHSLLIKKYIKAYYLRPVIKIMIRIFNHLNKRFATRLKKYYYRKLI